MLLGVGVGVVISVGVGVLYDMATHQLLCTHGTTIWPHIIQLHKCDCMRYRYRYRYLVHKLSPLSLLQGLVVSSLLS